MLTEKQIARIGWWMVNRTSSSVESNEASANVRATYNGKPAPYPQALPSQESACAHLRAMVAGMRVIESKFGGEDTLFDTPIRKGTPIYYGKFDGNSRTFDKAVMDALIGLE